MYFYCCWLSSKVKSFSSTGYLSLLVFLKKMEVQGSEPWTSCVQSKVLKLSSALGNMMGESARQLLPWLPIHSLVQFKMPGLAFHAQGPTDLNNCLSTQRTYATTPVITLERGVSLSLLAVRVTYVLPFFQHFKTFSRILCSISHPTHL